MDPFLKYLQAAESPRNDGRVDITIILHDFNTSLICSNYLFFSLRSSLYFLSPRHFLLNCVHEKNFLQFLIIFVSLKVLNNYTQLVILILAYMHGQNCHCLRKASNQTLNNDCPKIYKSSTKRVILSYYKSIHDLFRFIKVLKYVLFSTKNYLD